MSAFGSPEMTRVAITRPDVTLMLDRDGVIRGATLSDSIASEGVEAWVGRPWTETVGDAAGAQVRRMVADAQDRGVAAFLQVTQRFPSGLELPIEYTTVRLDPGNGLLAVGKNLQAVAELQSRLLAVQQAREQDYWKLREIETRSRLLFDASAEAVLLVSASNLRVIEANPAAIRGLGLAPGWDFGQEIAPRDRAAFREMLARVREHGRSPGALFHLGTAATPWLMRGSLMTREPGPVFLLQLSPATPEPAAAPVTPPRGEDLLEGMPDAFVITDAEGRIRRATRAFLDLAQAGTEASILGEPLGRWLAQPGMGAEVLLAQLRDHGEARLFHTVLTGNLGTEAEVEISGVATGANGRLAVGLLIRDIGRRMLPDDEAGTLRLALGSAMREMGRVPLPTLVRNTAAVVERACIEQALKDAGGNRTAAADALGLSRQSLYVKLDRYGIGEEGATQ